MRPSIFQGLVERASYRGKPDHGSPVHYRQDPPRNSVHSTKPLCAHGSYHIFWTTNPKRVTCLKCKEALANSFAPSPGA